jgi:hypothetical protein
MEFQTAELTLDEMDDVSGGCGTCGAVFAASAALAAEERANDLQRAINAMLIACAQGIKSAC